MMTETEVKTFCPANRQEWRAWLLEHHVQEKSVWLIYYKKKSNAERLTWSEAVDEALCFGWIDSIAKPLDGDRYMQFFSRRKPKSVWSGINKEKVRKLTDEGLMAQAGLDCIEIAKQNGSWTFMDDAQAMVVPPDLEAEFEKRPNANSYFLSLCKSDKRNILQWLVQAKRSETRQKRITEIIEQGDQNMKPKALQWNKKPAND
jgi:uncharacterized protein YdeI (YjbR/CyaY-like superfamily)